MSTLQESLLDAMSVLAESSVRNAPGTLTIECTITEVVNPGLGEYKVNYLENTLLVYTSNSNIEFNVGDRVYVLVPDGDFSKQKIILGASNPSTIVYEPSDSNNYMQVSDNLLNLDKNEIELCTYKSSIDIIKNKGNFNTVFPKYLKKYNTFGFSVKIKTSIPTDQQVNGNYGLKLELPFYTLKGENKINVIKTYTFDVDNISGNPYRLTEWSNQTMFIQIDEGLIYDESQQPKITVFVEGFAQKEFAENEEIPYDIFIKDINFSVYDELKEEHKVGYYLHISAERGNYFFNAKEETKKKLSLQLKSNGRDIKLSNVASSLEETYKCYWFKEDASVKHNSDYYSSIGGIGWKCLNERTNVNSNEDGSLSFNLITNQYTYEADISNVVTSARFKCVIVISKKSANGTVTATTVSNTIKLENLESKFKIKVASITGSNSYIKNIGEVNLICNVSKEDNNQSKDIFTYEWNRYDKNGKYLDDNFYTIVSNKNDDNGISQQIKFNTNLIDSANIFICSVYRNYVVDKNGVSISQNELLGTESILIDTNGTAAFILSIQNGDVLYKYDTDGDSPLRENYDGPLESRVDMIKPLTYTIYKADGSELSDSEYEYCYTTWQVSKNSMITATKLKDDNNLIEEDGDYYTYKGSGRFGFNYSLDSAYNYKKTNNTVVLKVKFGDVELTADAAIKILKEGDNGTNNSNYSAVIEHNEASYGEYKVYDEGKDGIIQKFQAIYITGGDNTDDNEKGWYYHNLNYKNNKLEELIKFSEENKNNFLFKIKVYRAGEEVTENYQVEWSMFDENNTTPCFEIKFDDKNKFYYLYPKSDWSNSSDIFVNIVQAKVTISNKAINEFTELYAYYPIEMVRVNSIDMIKIEEEYYIPTCINGFSSVLYSSDGTNPKYNSSEPFTCVDSVYGIGRDYDEYSWESSGNLKQITTSKNNQQKFKPIDKYNSSNSKNYVKATLKLSEIKKTEIETEKNNKITELKKFKSELNDIDVEENILKDFIKECGNFEKLNITENTKKFLANRAKLLNDLDELEKKANAIKSYSELINGTIDLSNNKNGKGESLNTIYISQLDKIKTIREKIKEVSVEKEEELTIPEFPTFITISIDQRPFIGDDINKFANYIAPSNGTRNTLGTYLTDFNDYLNNNYNSSKKNYIFSDEDFNSIIDFYDKVTKILENSEMYKNIYNQLIGYKNRLNIFDENCIYIQSEIETQIIKPSKSLVNYYGYLGKDEEGKETAILSEATINDFEDKKKQLLEDIASTEEKIKKLEMSLIKGKNGIIYIRPIIMLYNRYELSDIVGWDGNKLYTGKGKEGEYLYAPRVGAGKKEGDGSFTGIVIGNANNGGKEETGLFGYSKGARSIFLDANTGNAVFGKSGEGQIKIVPGDTSEIAGWKINENTLSGGEITLDKKGKVYSKKHNEFNNKTEGFCLDENGLSIGDKFKADNEGVLTVNKLIASVDGKIGGWKINENTLSGGEITLDKDGKIYSNSHNSFDSTSNGFYLDKNGLSIGSKFSVDKAGNLITKNITANGKGFIGGWEIDGSSLKSTDGNLTLNASGSITGPNWNISSSGKATFSDVIITSANGKASTIGGINILTGGGLSAGYTSNTAGWIVNSNGSAEFNNITTRGEIYADGGTLKDLTLKGDLVMEKENGKIKFGSGAISYTDYGITINSNLIRISASSSTTITGNTTIDNLTIKEKLTITEDTGSDPISLTKGELSNIKLLSTAATGNFIADGKTITVSNGLITSISTS